MLTIQLRACLAIAKHLLGTRDPLDVRERETDASFTHAYDNGEGYTCNTVHVIPLASGDYSVLLHHRATDCDGAHESDQDYLAKVTFRRNLKKRGPVLIPTVTVEKNGYSRQYDQFAQAMGY